MSIGSPAGHAGVACTVLLDCQLRQRTSLAASARCQQALQHGRQPGQHPLPRLVLRVDAVWGGGSRQGVQAGHMLRGRGRRSLASDPHAALLSAEPGAGRPRVSSQPQDRHGAAPHLGTGLAGGRRRRCSSAAVGRRRQPPRCAAQHSPPGPPCAAAAQGGVGKKVRGRPVLEGQLGHPAHHPQNAEAATNT